MRILDYKLLILLALTLIIYFLYREINNLKNRLDFVENNVKNNNSITNKTCNFNLDKEKIIDDNIENLEGGLLQNLEHISNNSNDKVSNSIKKFESDTESDSVISDVNASLLLKENECVDIYSNDNIDSDLKVSLEESITSELPDNILKENNQIVNLNIQNKLSTEKNQDYNKVIYMINENNHETNNEKLINLANLHDKNYYVENSHVENAHDENAHDENVHDENVHNENSYNENSQDENSQDENPQDENPQDEKPLDENPQDKNSRTEHLYNEKIKGKIKLSKNYLNKQKIKNLQKIAEERKINIFDKSTKKNKIKLKLIDEIIFYENNLSSKA